MVHHLVLCSQGASIPLEVAEAWVWIFSKTQVFTILGQEPSVQLVVDLDEEPIWVEAGVTIFSATLK